MFALLLPWLAGCLSTHPGSSSLAYVEIPTASVEAIMAETKRVFTEASYSIEQSGSDEAEFIRDATQRDKVMFGAYDQGPMRMRVKVFVEPYPRGGHLLRADAFVVSDGREDALMKVSRRPYQALLDSVRASLATSGE
jgi:hypothetical protein